MNRFDVLSPRLVLVAVAFLVSVTSGLDALAQSASGTLIRAHWPDVLYETEGGVMYRPGATAAENLADLEVLPQVDTLSLEYTASVLDDEPVIDLVLRWKQGRGGILDGKPVNEMPDSLALTLIDLHARVLMNGRQVGDLVLALDSLWLPADSFAYSFATASGWADLFEGMDEAAARNAFEAGFELEGLDILRARFDAPPAVQTVEREVLVVTRPPRRRTVFVPDTGVWIGWNIGPDPYRTRPRMRGDERRRGDSIGRTSGSDERRTRGGRDGATGSTTEGSTSTRGESATTSSDTGQSGSTTTDRTKGKRGGFPFGGKKDKDDDDDNDSDFLGPAVGAAMAVGALAYFGGSVGYFGYAADAPIGLQAGRVRAGGGVLLRAAVNSPVISGGGGERLVVGLAGVFRPLAAGIHPVVGLDVWFKERGDSYTATPILNAGLHWRLAPAAALQGGVELSEGRGWMGLVITFRQ